MVSSDLNLPDCLYLFTVFFKCMVDTGECPTFFMMDNTEEESRFLVNIWEKIVEEQVNSVTGKSVQCPTVELFQVIVF